MKTYLALSVLTGGAALLFFQNCSKANFNMIDPIEKADKLSNASVFGGTSEINATGRGSSGSNQIIGIGNGNNAGNINANAGSSGGSQVGASGDPKGQANVGASGGSNGQSNVDASSNGGKTGVTIDSSVIDLSFRCSNSQSATYGNVAEATRLNLVLTKSQNGKEVDVCTVSSPAVRTSILNDKQIDLALFESQCNTINDATYFLRVRNPDSTKTGGSFEQGLLVSTVLVRKVGLQFTTTSPSVHILADLNPSQANTVQILPNLKCDHRVSPLLLHLNSDVERPEPLQLTAPDRGVLFDILGLNADPRPHAKKQISWHRSPQYYFLALPDAAGRVNGINELFGDNTFGPDRAFATDGFHALAKFDGTTADGLRLVAKPDGLITREDPIFFKLRLWQDANADGKAQAGELKTLAQVGVEVIDLNFDPKYKEEDEFGNQTLYKSVVKDRNERLHLIFDVWFNPLEPGQRFVRQN